MNTEFTKFMSLTLANDQAPLSRLELTSVRALVAYAAYQQKVHEAVISEALTGKFGVSDISELTRRSYEQVIIFLTDIQDHLLLN